MLLINQIDFLRWKEAKSCFQIENTKNPWASIYSPFPGNVSVLQVWNWYDMMIGDIKVRKPEPMTFRAGRSYCNSAGVSFLLKPDVLFQTLLLLGMRPVWLLLMALGLVLKDLFQLISTQPQIFWRYLILISTEWREKHWPGTHAWNYAIKCTVLNNLLSVKERNTAGTEIPVLQICVRNNSPDC